MREIYAVIRPEKDRSTKAALAKLGITAYTSLRVLGRGRQGGLRYGTETNSNGKQKSLPGIKYLPKKLLYLVVDEGQADLAIETIIKANQSGDYGDGKIFVCDVENAVRIRTGEQQTAAVW